MNKKIKKTIIFLIIFCMLFYFISKILWTQKNPISYFYDEPKNSLDIVYIGSSNVYAHFNTVLAYNLYGYTTGILSSDTQPFILTKYLIEESEKYQSPSLYIIDIAKATEELKEFTGEEIRKTIDSMDFSKNRIDAINETLKYKEDITKDKYINYYFSFLMYHNRWKNIYESLANTYVNIFKNKSSYYKGYLFSAYTNRVETQNTYQWNESVMEVSDETETILNDLMNYIKSKKLNVLFVVPIKTYTQENNAKLNKMINILEKNEFKVINFNTLKDFNNINFSTDFYNANHLNVYGATKYTLYFAKYLKENYQLPDHREDKNYNSWNKEYSRFKKEYKKLINEDFESSISQ